VNPCSGRLASVPNVRTSAVVPGIMKRGRIWTARSRKSVEEGTVAQQEPGRLKAQMDGSQGSARPQIP